MKKTIALLGSTGSIGTQTLRCCKNLGYGVDVLAANRNAALLETQAREFHPRCVVVSDKTAYADLKTRLADTDIRLLAGVEGMCEAASLPGVDMVCNAVVGMVGLLPTLSAIEAGHDVALANKETLVTAGHLIMPLAKKKGVQILPVDSEHSAIFQCLQGNEGNRIHKILLTASGGPFRGRTRKEMEGVRPEDALKHPNWAMGSKITIDSSTMVNKGLEVMEARWLFDVDLEQIQVVVQPQSIIHSMVEFEDGAVMAQLGTPDMRLPIQYALYYPERRFLAGERLDFWKMGQITFEAPDLENFRGLALALRACREGGSVPTVFNAANELAVHLFLKGEISYLAITDLIEKAMDHHQRMAEPKLDDILNTEQETYDYINRQFRA